MIELLSKTYNHFKNDSLYKNSIFLMMSTAVMAFFGFFFWILNARLFTPEQVGIATALISVMTLISSFSLLGLNNGIIRFLPSSKNKNQIINTSFTITALSSIAIVFIYLMFINIFSPKLIFVRENIFFTIFFIFIVVITSLNSISDSVFIAHRSTIYILIKNTIFSIIKLVLPIFLIGLGAYGIFTSVGISITVALLLVMIYLILKFKYSIKPLIDRSVLEKMTKFSLGNYAAGIIGGLPTMILPIIILNNLGAKFSAFFYIDLMIASLLYIIPQATSQSLFAEGSYNNANVNANLFKAIKINFLILIPAIILTFIFGEYILLTFGKWYSSEGILLLKIFTLSSIFVSINSIFGSILKIKHKINQLILISLIGTGSILSLTYVFTSNGLLGVGLAWLIGNIILSIIYILLYYGKKD